MFADIYFTIIILIPLYIALLYSYYYPEDSVLFGRRWMFKKEPQLSEQVIRYTKFSSLLTMIYLPFFVLLLFIQRFVLVIMFIVYLILIISGAIRIFLEGS